MLLATIGFGVLSFIAFILERLALTDIFHGEPDLHLEWTVVNAAFLPILLFHVLGVVCIILTVRRLEGPSPRNPAQQADAADRPTAGR